jgi:hypothetical protein
VLCVLSCTNARRGGVVNCKMLLHTAAAVLCYALLPFPSCIQRSAVLFSQAGHLCSLLPTLGLGMCWAVPASEPPASGEISAKGVKIQQQ